MAMEELYRQVWACRKCRLWQGAKHGVPGEGPLNAKIMVVGQNPGALEDETGRPFVGNAGKFLTRALTENGLKREDLFITNIVKHKTPKNRKPLADEVTACLPYLIMQIELIHPEKILLLGETAKKTPRVGGIEYFELIHPQAAARFPRAKLKFDRQIRQFIESLPEEEYEGIPRGKIPWDPRIDYVKCTTCGKCIEFCHTGAFKLGEKNGQKRTTVKPSTCIVLCRGCENICPQGAISHPDEEITQKIIDKLKTEGKMK